MASTYDPGTRCWIQDTKEGWVGAEVKSKDINDNKVVLTLALENGTETQVNASVADLEENSSKLPPLRNPPILESTEDLTSLSYLNEPAVLNAIKMRYGQLNIYTYSGIVLIATNPFQRVDNLYTPDIIQAYSGKPRGELEPHLFAIAEDAYRCMLRDKRNQTIVVSGESGAGKTVSAKYIMRYFATVEDADHPHLHVSASSQSGDVLSETEEQILATNPIMEAFGNAKTTRNDNSSRFGKYLEILFDSNVEIIGARIRTYLLERSRLVFQPSTERNYHIFYQLCAGTTDEEKAKFSLKPVQEFNYLNQGGDPVIEGVDDAEEFSLTRQALSTIGINEGVQESIFKVLSALLHIGNIAIQATRTQAMLAADEPSLVITSELLGIDATQLSKWLVKKQIKTRSEKIVTNLDLKQATVVRDSVSKYIYSTLFDWLVSLINRGLCAESVAERVSSFIGVLDIYGFEHFKSNSFEQFCINYANEKLQQEFNQHVFKLEQDEYVNEEINWKFIEFSDNQPCITLIESKLGILSLLDEESRLPSGSDESWVGKLYQNFDNSKHSKYFKKPRFGNTGFIVSHYAMDVTYESEGFIEKNRDSVPEELIEVLNETTSPFLKEILQVSKVETVQPAAGAAPAPGKRMVTRKPTLGSIFKGSLIELMSTINSTNVHYIRCIKPNDEKAAWQFDGPMVLSQLRACGVLETIRISCDGFPSRWTYEDFGSRYYMLVPSSEWAGDIKVLCNKILQATISDSEKYQLGKTKIFFRAGMLAYLENQRGARLDYCATIIQKNLRMVYHRNQYQAIRRSVIALQTIVRGYLTRARTESLRCETAAIKIQSKWRAYSQRQSFLSARAGTVELQARIRGYLVRQRLYSDRCNSAALLIQSLWRGYAVRQVHQKNLHDIIVCQSSIRRYFARKELKTLKVEAKSVSHYREVQYKLENKVVELTQVLAGRKDENKKLTAELDALQKDMLAMQAKHKDAEERHKEEYEEAEQKHSGLTAALEAIKQELAAKQKEFNDTAKTLEQSLAENKKLQQELQTNYDALEAADKTIKQFETNEVSLNQTIAQLREDLEAAAKAQIAAAAASTVAPIRSLNGTVTTTKKRSAKRRSFTGPSAADSHNGFAPRPASVMIPNDYRGLSDETDSAVGGSTGLDAEIERLLDDEKVIYQEAIQGLIFNLKVPPPGSNDKISPKEILFPANIVNLIVSEMWRLGFTKESERFLGMVMQAIQDTVVKHTGESIINPGAFWLSNVHEILSFLYLAEANIVQNEELVTEMGEAEFHEYGRLVAVAKTDLENLEFNLYHSWMKEIRKVLDKMIVPALIITQSLPGFVTQDNTRFLSKLLNNSPQYNMDDFLSMFNQIYRAMSCYCLEHSFIKQPINELLKQVGVKAFNDLLLRRNFLSWKRGLQINYNITRVEEWCKAHNLAEGIIRLEHLVESVKLLQLKKATLDDIEIIYDICWTLSPLQIQRIINQYLVADYEQPISAEILNAVAARVKTDANQTFLLDSTSLDNSGPFEIIEPRVLRRIESYIPGWLPVPNLKRLAELTAIVNAQQNGGAKPGVEEQDGDVHFDEGAAVAPQPEPTAV